MKKELKTFAVLLAVFLLAFFMPVKSDAFRNALFNALEMLQWYAVNHTLGCVVPAMFIAGAISVFCSREKVLRVLGPGANPLKAYGIASVSGVLLAVCSCSVLPMFAGIFRVGAGLGPASTFLCSGPALNVMAIFMSARVLGLKMGLGRTSLSILMSILVGVFMSLIFYRSEKNRVQSIAMRILPTENSRKPWQTGLFLGLMVAFLVFSDWVPYDACPWSVTVYQNRWWFCAGILVICLGVLWKWFQKDEITEWLGQTWSFAKSIIPLLFGGIFVTGFLTSFLTPEIVSQYVGGNSLTANLISSVLGLFWYFSTLSEIPMLDSLMSLGMGEGPAMALLLAGPTLSLPSVWVLCRIMGWKRTLGFSLLIILFSVTFGMIFGSLNF